MASSSPQKSDMAENVPYQAPATCYIPLVKFSYNTVDDNDMPPLEAVGDSDNEETLSHGMKPSTMLIPHLLVAPQAMTMRAPVMAARPAVNPTETQRMLLGDDVNDDTESSSDKEPDHGEDASQTSSTDKAELACDEAAAGLSSQANLQSDSDAAKPANKSPRAVKEHQIDAALAAIKVSGLKPNGKPKESICSVAKTFGIASSTLNNCWNGKKSPINLHIPQRKLNPMEEGVLVDWIKEVGQHGVPIGMLWYRHFKKRHPELAVYWAMKLQACCAKALNRPKVTRYFSLLQQVVEDYGIPHENIYNMDEKGVQLGIMDDIKVLVDCDQRDVYNIKNSNCELITIIECICADGTVICPCVIFKGKRMNKMWGLVNLANASITVLPNGWTDNELGTLWLKNDFELQTACRNISGKPHLLILDGHNSHCMYEFCHFTETHNIQIVCLPPHTTHKLQPLMWESLGPSQRTTGILLLDPSVIPNDAYAPALATTTQSAPVVPNWNLLPHLLVPFSDEDTDKFNLPTTSAVAGPLTPGPLTSPHYSEPMAPAHIRTIAIIPGLLPPLPANARRHMLIQHAAQLRTIADAACTQVYHDRVLLSLKDHENTALWQQLHLKVKTLPGKAKGKGKGKGHNKKAGDGEARHLTGEAILASLAQEEADVKERETAKADAAAECKQKVQEAVAKKAEK
ncbi:DDE-domain-containing protein, partial [Daedalea quercina L-15889]